MTGVGPQHNSNATAIRRIRHSEVVLVDDVVYQHNNYWLRLRWPGTKGGFAGYVCLLAHQNTILSSSSSSSMDGRKAQDSHNMQSGESKVKVKSTIRFDSIRSDPIYSLLLLKGNSVFLIFTPHTTSLYYFLRCFRPTS